MEIIVNQQKQIIPEGLTVEQLLLQLLPEAPKGVAIAVNHSIVPKASWSSHRFSEHDKVTIIRATQGG